MTPCPRRGAEIHSALAARRELSRHRPSARLRAGYRRLPRGGAYPRQQAQGRSGVEGGPSTVYPDTWELKQLKHSVRWTVYVPQARREELQRRAAARGQNPSLLVQEALARWLVEEA
jgi:hypothetical protein